MICPECRRPTKRLIYDRHGARCPDCANPGYVWPLISPPPAPSIAPPTIDREAVGRTAYEAYRKSLNRTTDDNLPQWEWADHETQLAFRDAGEAVARMERTTLP